MKMNMIPYHRINKSAYQDYLVIELSHFKGNILVVENYCTDPNCYCHDVSLSFVHLNDDGKIKSTLLSFNLNLDSGKVSEQVFYQADINGIELINEFVFHFNEIKKQYLNHEQNVKQYYANNPSVNLPESALELINLGNTVEYAKLFPGNQLTINYNNDTYYIEDQYCMKPNCACNEVIMVVYKKDHYNAEFVFRLELFTKLTDVMNIYNVKVSSDMEPMIEVITQDDEMIRVLKGRYKQMKNVGKQNLSSKPVVQTYKIGRNDPCSCGSGKKYKRCCG